MRTTAPQPVTTPIPVQLSEPEFPALLLPHLAMPKRGPKCPRGESRVFTLIWWVLDTEMPWQCWPVPQAAHGHPAIHDTTVYPVLATWADDGALWPAFRARGRPLAAAPRHPRAPWRRPPPRGQTRGEGMGSSGHQHQQGAKGIASIDQQGSV
jgi:hypothetical protein